MSRARTVQETREWFEATGQTVAEWADDHGFSASVVYALLAGRTRGRRGNAHRAAVALGLKPDIPKPERHSDASRVLLAAGRTPGGRPMK